jgi:hypothetical protein
VFDSMTGPHVRASDETFEIAVDRTGNPPSATTSRAALNRSTKMGSAARRYARLADGVAEARRDYGTSAGP